MTKRTHSLIWLLLPLLLLRGMVPAGFMVDVSQGKVAIVVCPGHILTQSPVSGADSANLSATDFGAVDHEHHGPMERREQSSSQLCPFAATAAAAPPPSFTPQLAAVVPAIAVTFEISSEPATLAGPARSQQSRAPPYFS
jgi:hypothetical protein